MFSRTKSKIATMLLAVALITAAPRQSQAIAPAVVIAVVDFAIKAYGYYKTAATLIGGSGPDLATQLNNVETDILNALATQRNQQWKANAQTVFDNFQILGFRPPGDPQNAFLWSSTVELSKNTINLYAQLVDDVSAGVSSDVDSNYQLAPMFTALVTTHTGLNKMKGEIWPTAPATWGENNIVLSRAMSVDYQLVGSEGYVCSTNVNFGAGCYTADCPLANFSWSIRGITPPTDTGNLDAVAKSQLFKKLNWVNVKVGTVPVNMTSSFSCTPVQVSKPTYCDPVTATCTRVFNSSNLSCTDAACSLNGCFCGCASIVWPTHPIDSNSFEVFSARLRAIATTFETDSLLGPTHASFNSDGVVQIVHAGMTSIMNVGGGQAQSDGASLTLPVTGKLVDPYVIEPACSTIYPPSGGKAYPALTTTQGVTPVSFADGFQQQGDANNIFPNSQVRLSDPTGEDITRSHLLNTPGTHNYTLFIRYNQPHTVGTVVRVSLQNGDTAATVKVFGNIPFDPTGVGWQVKELNFNATSSWPQITYLRLQYESGAIAYFDAVWVRQN